MEFHALINGRRVLLHSTDQSMKYEKIDTATVAAKRREHIAAGRAPAPRLACNFCGHVVGKGALWCSTECANDYAKERTALTVEGG